MEQSKSSLRVKDSVVNGVRLLLDGSVLVSARMPLCKPSLVTTDRRSSATALRFAGVDASVAEQLLVTSVDSELAGGSARSI